MRRPILTTPIEFYDSFGGRVSMSPLHYFELLGHRGTQTYLALVFSILVATDAPGLLGQINFGATLGIWAVVLSAFLLCHGLVLLLCGAVLSAIGTVVLPGILITATAMILPVSLGEALLHFSSHGAVNFSLFPQLWFYIIVAETFVMIYMRYVRPDVGVDMTMPEAIGPEADQPETSVFPEAPAGSPPAEPIRHILIGAEPVPLPQLRHIQAQEHHVHVTLDGERLTHRARLSDIVAQTAPEDGIQPHRSWWVARHVARELERDGQKHVLRLDDGTRVPVARSRLPEVRDWLDEAT